MYVTLLHLQGGFTFLKLHASRLAPYLNVSVWPLDITKIWNEALFTLGLYDTHCQGFLGWLKFHESLPFRDSCPVKLKKQPLMEEISSPRNHSYPYIPKISRTVSWAKIFTGEDNFPADAATSGSLWLPARIKSTCNNMSCNGKVKCKITHRFHSKCPSRLLTWASWPPE